MYDLDLPIRVLIADGHMLFRQAVRRVLQGDGGIEVVAECGDGRDVVALAEDAQPDVALLDAGLPDCDGVTATYMLRHRVPRCRVLLLASSDDLALLEAAVKAGASGFLTKEAPLRDLLHATRAIQMGDTVIPPRLLGGLLSRLLASRNGQEDALRRISRLSKREKEVLALLAQGGNNEKIARALVISPETARTHIQHVLEKLGVHSRVEAAALVLQNNLQDELLVVKT